MKATPIILLIGATVLADQATKTVALLLLSPGEVLPVVPGFNVTLGFNEGASFGMMSDAMAGRPLLMAALTGGLALMFAIMAFATLGYFVRTERRHYLAATDPNYVIKPKRVRLSELDERVEDELAR